MTSTIEHHRRFGIMDPWTLDHMDSWTPRLVDSCTLGLLNLGTWIYELLEFQTFEMREIVRSFGLMKPYIPGYSWTSRIFGSRTHRLSNFRHFNKLFATVLLLAHIFSMLFVRPMSLVAFPSGPIYSIASPSEHTFPISLLLSPVRSILSLLGHTCVRSLQRDHMCLLLWVRRGIPHTRRMAI